MRIFLIVTLGIAFDKSDVAQVRLHLFAARTVEKVAAGYIYVVPKDRSSTACKAFLEAFFCASTETVNNSKNDSKNADRVFKILNISMPP